MSRDDIIYLCLLFFCIGFGHYFRKLKTASAKQWVSSTVGFILVFIVSGFHSLHIIFVILVNSFIILRLSKKHCHISSFIFTFLYLCFFRTTYYFGIPCPPGHTNSVQMILTLKIVGLAFEVHDTYMRKKKKLTNNESDKSLELEDEFESVEPSFWDIFQYCFCYVGIFTGPYYKFRTYRDLLDTPYSENASCWEVTWRRGKYVPIYTVLYLVSVEYFPFQFVEYPEIYSQHSVWYRIFYVNPIFFIFRMRIYIAFVLSECGCIMAGLGAYPSCAKSKSGQGPSDLVALKEINEDKEKLKATPYDFTTVYNIDEYNAEFSTTVRLGMKHWNMTVQYWLAIYVYKKLPSKAPRVFLTMLMSAIWHGVYSGYYLSLCTVPFILVVETMYEKLIRRNLSEKGKKIYDFISWVHKMQAFGYMGLAFFLLRIDTTMYYWQSIYFCGHVLIAICYVIGLLIIKIKKPQHEHAS